MTEISQTGTTTTTSKSSVEDISISDTGNIEKLVEFTKTISEQKMQIQSLETDKANQQAEIEKYKADIARLQKVIADNFIITTEKPTVDIPQTKSFKDAYREMIIENEKANEKK